MDTARLIQSGHSLAVGSPENDPWYMLYAGLAAFEPSFVLTRNQNDEHGFGRLQRSAGEQSNVLWPTA